MQKIKLPSIKELEHNCLNVYEALALLRGLRPSYGDKPHKPMLKQNASSKDALQYSKDLVEYEVLLSEYDFKKQEIQKICNEIDLAIEQYIKEMSGFNKHVPEEYKTKVWNKAMEYGHSNDYQDVYFQLVSLVEIF